MAKINDGGPAYPGIAFLEKNDAHAPERRSKYAVVGQHGMSLRAYLAGKALVAIGDLFEVNSDDRVTAASQRVVAKLCVGYADALIAELAKDTTS